MRHRSLRIWPVAVAAAASVLVAEGALAGMSFADRVRRDTEWLASYSTRVVGTPEHDRAAAALLARVSAVPGIRVWQHEFTAVVPHVLEARLAISSGESRGEHRIFPLWPASVRLNCTPSDGIAGRLVYVARAEPGSLPARSLRGQIAVMEAAAGLAWRKVHGLGAKAVVLLGSPEDCYEQLGAHLTPLPINFPRFYIPDGALANALRKARDTEGTISCRAEWRETKARNIYALVTPATPATPEPALAIASAFDSMSVVPELAPGADAAVDTAFLLNAMEDLADERPSRPLLFVFADACSINLLGMRVMLQTLGASPGEAAMHLQEDEERLAEYRGHEKLAAGLIALPDGLAQLHARRFKPLHRYIKDEASREVLAVEAELHPLRLRAFETSGDTRLELEKRVAELARRRAAFLAAQAQMLSSRPLKKNLVPLAELLWQRAGKRITEQAAEVERRLAAQDGRDRLRGEILGALDLNAQAPGPVSFLLGIDLSDAGVAIGPSLFCNYLSVNEKANANDLLKWLRGIEKQGSEKLWPGRLRRSVNTAPLMGLDTPESFAVGSTLNLTSPARSFGLPAMTWATLEAPRLRVDTPADTAERLDWERLRPQAEATLSFTKALAGAEGFRPSGAPVPGWSRVRGSVVDMSPGEPIPRLPMKGYLTTLVSGSCAGGRARVYWTPAVPGMRRQEFRFTGADGGFVFDAVPGDVGWYARRVFVQSCLLDADGSIVRAVDINKVGKGAKLNIDVRSRRAGPLRAVVFTCRELSGLEFFDPRFLLNLSSGTILDARRGGKPQRVNFSLYQGQMTCLLEPGTRWQLILRAGTTRNRLALVNMASAEESRQMTTREAMRGFDLGEPMPLMPLQMAAQDMFRLDERRISEYKRAGIASEAIEKVHRRTRAMLEKADEAVEQDDGAALFEAASGALANEVRVYQAVRDLANDIIRAAVFLLLMLVPFSYAAERLVLSTPHIYRQIAFAGIIFAVMTAMLWSFHPAFRISGQPMMIIMAFGIIFMSLLVISVVYSKFESGLEEARSGRAEASAAQTSRAGVLMSAVRLGMANMRKRKIRTGLTGVSVVIITFVLLCFTSTSSFEGRVEYGLAAKAPYSGALVRQPSTRPMPDQALAYVKAVVAEGPVVVPRYWWSNQWNPQWCLHVMAPASGGQVSLKAAVGLSPEEADLTGLGQILPEWPRFAAEGGCYLAEETSEKLGVEAGDTVIVAGRPLEVIGVFSSSRFDSEVRDMDGQPLLPFDFSALSGDQRRLLASGNVDILAAEMESGSGLEPDMALPRLSSASVIIVPAAMLKGLRESSLRSVAIRTESVHAAQQLAQRLSGRLAFPVYYSSEDAVRVLAATVLLPEGPTSILVPLMIGGLIIFNTMLGSVAERKREIHVYTSLGLAPLHVGVLFLAEAMTYGLMGSIFGYIAGQGVATVLDSLGLMAGMTLNYSGTQAIATMVMVLGIVMVSSLVPAYVAGKVAVPSSHMSWRVPEPDGDIIRDVLPFTLTGQTANGVIAYLIEYLDAHREGSIGNFSTDNVRAFQVAGGGLDLMGIEGTVWLAPYDLGVRQDVRLVLRPTEEEDVVEIEVELRCESGQRSSWWKLNRVFLGDLRKQLLGWRKLREDRILQYIAEAAEMSASSAMPPG